MLSFLKKDDGQATTRIHLTQLPLRSFSCAQQSQQKRGWQLKRSVEKYLRGIQEHRKYETKGK